MLAKEGDLFQLDCVGRLSQGSNTYPPRQRRLVLLAFRFRSYGFDPSSRSTPFAQSAIIVLTGTTTRRSRSPGRSLCAVVPAGKD